MKFKTQFDFVDSKRGIWIDSEKLSNESLFEFGTYRDTQTMVEEFLVAGKNLQEIREHQFDDIDDVGDFSLPTTRMKGSDIVDIHDEFNSLNESINQSVKNAKSESVAKNDVAKKTDYNKTVEQSDKVATE